MVTCGGADVVVTCDAITSKVDEWDIEAEGSWEIEVSLIRQALPMVEFDSAVCRQPL